MEMFSSASFWGVARPVSIPDRSATGRAPLQLNKSEFKDLKNVPQSTWTFVGSIHGLVRGVVQLSKDIH